MTVNGTTTRVLYDGDQAIAETDAAGTLQTTTIAGPGLDAPVRLGQGAKARYVCADALGSPVLLTDAAGTVLERYRYDAFGAPTITSATGQALSRSAYGNRILFTGREYEAETGLYYYRARYYSPTLGRFLSRDPLGPLPDLNLYRYVGNNPATWLDPWGLDKQRHDAPEPNTPPAPPFDPPPFFPLLMPIPLMTSSGPVLVPGVVPVPGLPLPRPGVLPAKRDRPKQGTQDKKLSPHEIEKLKRRGLDVEGLKGKKNTGGLDLYKDEHGNILIKPRGGIGPGEPTGLNINGP